MQKFHNPSYATGGAGFHFFQSLPNERCRHWIIVMLIQKLPLRSSRLSVGR